MGCGSDVSLKRLQLMDVISRECANSDVNLKHKQLYRAITPSMQHTENDWAQAT